MSRTNKKKDCKMLDSQLNYDYRAQIGTDYSYPEHYEDDEYFIQLMKETIIETFVEDDKTGYYDDMTDLEDVLRILKSQKKWSEIYERYYDKSYNLIIKHFHECELMKA